MIECSLAQGCEGERKGTGAMNRPCCLCLAGFPFLHWVSLPLTLLQGLSHWLTGALPSRAKKRCVTCVG